MDKRTKDPKDIGARFDKFAEDLQQELFDEELQEYNKRIVELFHDPPNFGRLDGKDIIEHSYLGPCGDQMTFFLRIDKGIIKKANFITTGCGASVATGAQTTLLVEGKNVDDVANLAAAAIDDALGGLPLDHKHCAELAARTMHQALEKYRTTNDGLR